MLDLLFFKVLPWSKKAKRSGRNLGANGVVGYHQVNAVWKEIDIRWLAAL